MNVDIILQWCVYCDYPLWRQMVQINRDRFNKVILYPSRHHGVVDLESFAKSVFKETWVDPVTIDYGKVEWKQGETDPCIPYSDAEWIWFTEQDFFVEDWKKFYDDVEQSMKTSDMIGWWNPTHTPYISPSCLFIKRELFEKTTKDFRAHPEINGSDCSATLTYDAIKLGAKITTIQDLGYIQWKDAFHLGGLTYIYQDWKGDGTDIFGTSNNEIFYIYNYWMRQANVDQSPHFMNLSYEIEKVLQQKYPNVNVEDNEWSHFFKL